MVPSQIGDRLARLRTRRDLTQEELSARSGVSVDVIRRLEQGVRRSARLASLSRLASALDVELSHLMAAQVTLAGPRPELAAGMLDLRRALTPADGLAGFADYAHDDADRVDVAALSSSIDTAWDLYQAGQYSVVTAALPDLIAETRHAVREAVDGGKVAAAHALSSTACEVAAGIAIALGKEDLSFIAVSQAVAAAEDSGDELFRACSANFAAWIYCRQGRYEESEAFAVAAATRHEPSISRGDPQHVAVFGALLVNAAAAAARAERAESCRDLLGIARSAAARYGADRADRHGVFGPAVVAMSAVNAAVEYDDLDEAMRLIAEVPERHAVPPTWTARYLLNVAHIHTEARADDQALATLRRVRKLTPEWMRYHVQAREVTAELLQRATRRRRPELAVLADYLGVGV